MLRVQGYQFEALPNGEQLRNLRRFAGSCRFVYNQALALNKQRYENKEKRLGYARMCALLPSWKTAHPWLSDAPSQALQQSLKDLERAYTNFFQKRADFPDFHKKGRKDSFRIPQGFEVDSSNGRISLPKIGWMRYRKSRGIAGRPKNVTVSIVAGKVFVSIQTEREVEPVMHPSTSLVGVDWGVVNFVTMSNGEVIGQCAPLEQHARNSRSGSVGWLARRNSRITGRKQRPGSAGCINTSPISERISYTRPPTASAKTTRLS